MVAISPMATIFFLILPLLRPRGYAGHSHIYPDSGNFWSFRAVLIPFGHEDHLRGMYCPFEPFQVHWHIILNTYHSPALSIIPIPSSVIQAF
jgi:hypothetical protein